ncbi:MAG: VOC family protein [Sandaracinaceae bacterium]
MKQIFMTVLRTTDVEAAERFYEAVLGVKPAGVMPLHERAIARGAPPHWLGFVDVGDVDAAVADVVARGFTSLGPKWTNPEGLQAAYVRDPGGAVLALAKPPARPLAPSVPPAVYQSLDTPDVAGAIAAYGELFGWRFDDPLHVEGHAFHPFAWEAGSPRVGVFGDSTRRPGIHPHWTYFFAVEALDAAVARVEANGGVSVGILALPGGDRIAVCDDPQGAAFALYEASRGHR